MAFIKTSDYEKSFSEERNALKKELGEMTGKDPRALEKYVVPADTRKSVGGIAVTTLVALLINLVLSLLLAALMDVAFPNYDTMPQSQKDTITTVIWLSMLVLPIVAVTVCTLKNRKVRAQLAAYARLQQTAEYQDALRIQNEYKDRKAQAKKKMDEFDAKVDPDRMMGVLYVCGGAPADGKTYMGEVCIDEPENGMILSYRLAPYEIFVPAGMHDIMIKSGNRIVWKESFYFSAQRVYTVDIAGAADSAELSQSLNRYSDSGRSDIRYQEITKAQYRKALSSMKKPISYVFQ